jgi:hypothetical protein
MMEDTMSDQNAANMRQTPPENVPDDRVTTHIRRRAESHLGAIQAITRELTDLANSLFGFLPVPGIAPAMGVQGSQIEPVKAQIEAIDSVQFMIDEELESLRRQLSRFGAL